MKLQKPWPGLPVAFLSGSGVSLPSGIPTGMAFSAAFASVIDGSAKRGKQMLPALVTTDCEGSLHRVRFEQLLQIWRDTADPNLEILNVFEGGWTPTGIHTFLADAMHEGFPVFTTNFDGLIEAAYIARHGTGLCQVFLNSGSGTTFAAYESTARTRPTLFKLHGTLRTLHDIQRILDGKKPVRRQIASVGATLDKIGDGRRVVGLEISKEHCLTNELRGKVLIVLGYSGLDDFDVIPSLRHALTGSAGLIWIRHRDTADVEPRSSVLADLLPMPLFQLTHVIPVRLALGRTDDVLANLFRMRVDRTYVGVKKTPKQMLGAIPAVRGA
jgi:hypothetical protein